jgi:hypothetical protein
MVVRAGVVSTAATFQAKALATQGKQKKQALPVTVNNSERRATV